MALTQLQHLARCRDEMNLHLAPEQVGFRHGEDLTVASEHKWWEGGERKAVEAVPAFRQPGRGRDSRHGAAGRAGGSIRCPSGNECFMSWGWVWGKLSAGPASGLCSHLVLLLW